MTMWDNDKGHQREKPTRDKMMHKRHDCKNNVDQVVATTARTTDDDDEKDDDNNDEDSNDDNK